MMRPDTSYVLRVDQPRFTALFDIPGARRRSRSLRKLTTSLGSLLRACDHDIAT
jgi:hypothetical protein